MRRWLASLVPVAAASTVAPMLYGALTPGPPFRESAPMELPARVIPPEAPRYGLQVVDIPEPPKELLAAWEAVELGATELEETVRPLRAHGDCPVELRAIIAGGEADGFAMVAFDGESTVARPGDRLATTLGPARVAGLTNTHMTLTGGFGKRRCTLDSER